MRRGYGLILMLSVLGSWAPSALGQYPPPYGPAPYGPMPMQPMPMQPMPMQPMPMPYGPMPMQPMPMPYGPMPMQPMPMQQPPKVFVYGPLMDAPPDPLAPLGGRNPNVRPMNPNDPKSKVTQAQMTLPAAGAAVPTSNIKTAVPLESACAGCFDGSCEPAPAYSFIPKDDDCLPGHGHFIGEVGGLVLVPYVNPRTTFSTMNAAGGSTSEFPQQADYGPSFTFGYIFHNDWGFRANYWYLHGSESETFGNADPTLTVSTPAAGGLGISGPSMSLANGIGNDQYEFWQRLRMDVANVEILKEQHIFDTTLLFGFGCQYARIDQSYAALRNNAGGINAAGTLYMAMDRTDFSSENMWSGFGPTFSFEILHPIGKSCFSFYANVRASFLWGVDSFDQNLRVQQRGVTAGGVVIANDSITSASEDIHRQVECGEFEAGIQYGCAITRRFYLYGRAGVVVQRWWNVGNPVTPNSNVELVGGALRIGLSF